MNHHCTVDEEDLGPFLLGHLDAGRAAVVAGQIAACPACSAEVERLRPVVDALARSSPPPAVVAPVEPTPAGRVRTARFEPHDPSAGVPGVPRAVAAPRPRPRLRLALAASALAIFAGSVSVIAVSAQGDDGRQVVLAGPTAVSASAVLLEKRWGTEIELQVSGLVPNETYGVWLERREGGRLPAGTFRPDSSGTFRITLASAQQLDDSRALGVARLPGGRVADAVDVLAAPLE